MTATRGLGLADGMFQSTLEMQEANLTKNKVVSVRADTTIQFYRIDSDDKGVATLLDNGLFANPVGAVEGGKWVNKSSSFTVFAGKSYQIDASGGSVDGTLKEAYNIGDVIIVHNESISTNLVRLTNTALTLKGPKGTITPADNLVLAPGDTAHFAFKTSTIAEAV